MLRTTFTTLKRSTQIIQRPLSLSGIRLYHEKVFFKKKYNIIPCKLICVCVGY